MTWEPATSAPVDSDRSGTHDPMDAARRVSLQESVQRSGSGRPPAELELEALR